MTLVSSESVDAIPPHNIEHVLPHGVPLVLADFTKFRNQMASLLRGLDFSQYS